MPPLPSQGFDQKLILIKRNALAATLSIDLGFRKGVSGEITQEVTAVILKKDGHGLDPGSSDGNDEKQLIIDVF